MGNGKRGGQVVDVRDGATDTDVRAFGSGECSDAAATRAARFELDALARGGMISTTGSGGGDTNAVDDHLDDHLDEFARGVHDIDPHDRPSLDELIDEFGLLPFERAVTSSDTSPHRYTWFGLEVEKGARSVTFTLSHGEPARYWMYLVDPSGNEVHPSSAAVTAWHAGPEPYESAEIGHPAAGQWLVIGVRFDRGSAVPSKAIAAIDHDEVAVFGEALPRVGSRAVEFRAGARFVEPLTGLSVMARVRRPGGPWHHVRLHDDVSTGDYRGLADLPEGAYTGFIEIRAPERPLVANTPHTPMHGGRHDGIDAARAETAGFLRHVPVSAVLIGNPAVTEHDAGEGELSAVGLRRPLDHRRRTRPPHRAGRFGTSAGTPFAVSR